jgi:hypothetical protein
MHGVHVVYATGGGARDEGERGMWLGVIVRVPDVRGFRFVESEHVGTESENNGDAETDSRAGETERRKVDFFVARSCHRGALDHMTVGDDIG